MTTYKCKKENCIGTVTFPKDDAKHMVEIPRPAQCNECHTWYFERDFKEHGKDASK